MRHLALISLLVVLSPSIKVSAEDGNRLVYLDESDPYYVSRTSPKLITPQWIGEKDVEAVVILAIDDMRDHNKYETYLRPILKRLKKIDGRAPISIMTNRINVDTELPPLKAWLQEGLSIDTHTFDHPCPFFKMGDFEKAKATYDRCIDLMNEIPKSKPIAFRMPCCDSLNTPSPRFYTEIFNKTTPKGNFLTIDTSVFHFFTSKDPELPRELVMEDGQERFRKYSPRDRTFVNTIDDYPYPYVLGRLCWEFPCMAPSDWEAQHLHKPNNPITVRDWKAAIDAVVIKKGVFTMVFHPHGWIRNDQIVELIDHVETKHGKKVKFLTFPEAQARIDKYLLAGHPVRRPKDGRDNGVRLVDVNNDGYLDVIISNSQLSITRLWEPKKQTWIQTTFQVDLTRFSTQASDVENGARFGVVTKDGHASLLVRSENERGAWHFDGKKWIEDLSLLNGLELNGKPLLTIANGVSTGTRFRDLNNDGLCELIVSNPKQQAIFEWSPTKKTWVKLSFALPPNAVLVDAEGRDNGARFVDVNQDGYDDVLYSNDKHCGLCLFASMKQGWARKIFADKRDQKATLPRFVTNGTNNGAWFHSDHLWLSNETTPLLKDHVYRLSYKKMLEKERGSE